MRPRQPMFHRKLYVFLVDRAERTGWERCGRVLLPDNAFREEIAHALRVFGMRVPRVSPPFGDRVSWTYAFSPAHLLGDARGPSAPIAWPVARIHDLNDVPLVRLVSERVLDCRRDFGDVGRNTLRE